MYDIWTKIFWGRNYQVMQSGLCHKFGTSWKISIFDITNAMQYYAQGQLWELFYQTNLYLWHPILLKLQKKSLISIFFLYYYSCWVNSSIINYLTRAMNNITLRDISSLTAQKLTKVIEFNRILMSHNISTCL